MIVGSSGTPASAAIRAAPALNSLSSKDRLMVASGNTPTISPARSAVDRGAVGPGTGLAVDRDVVHAAHQRAADPVGEDLLLGHEPHQPPGRAAPPARRR